MSSIEKKQKKTNKQNNKTKQEKTADIKILS